MAKGKRKADVESLLQKLDSDSVHGESVQEYEELTPEDKRLAEALYRLDSGAESAEDYEVLFQYLFGVSTKESDGTLKNPLDIFREASEKI